MVVLVGALGLMLAAIAYKIQKDVREVHLIKTCKIVPKASFACGGCEYYKRCKKYQTWLRDNTRHANR